MPIGTIRPVLVSFLILLVLYIGAILLGWFDMYAWFDIPMHILGGIWVAALFLFLGRGFFQYEIYAHQTEKLKIISLVVAYSGFVGILWEFFEYLLSPYFEVFKQNSVKDTLGDLCMDMVGGLGYATLVFFILPYILQKISEGRVRKTDRIS